jgi:hypothetical protein
MQDRMHFTLIVALVDPKPYEEFTVTLEQFFDIVDHERIAEPFWAEQDAVVTWVDIE